MLIDSKELVEFLERRLKKDEKEQKILEEQKDGMALWYNGKVSAIKVTLFHLAILEKFNQSK